MKVCIFSVTLFSPNFRHSLIFFKILKKNLIAPFPERNTEIDWNAGMFHYRGKPKQNWQLCFPLSIFHLFIIWSVYISFIMWLFFLILVFLTVYFLLFLDFKQLLWSNNYCSRTKQCLSDYFKSYFEVCYYSFVTFILWFFMRQR